MASDSEFGLAAYFCPQHGPHPASLEYDTDENSRAIIYLLQPLERQEVGLSPAVFLQSIHKQLIIGCGVGEQRHARSELQIVGRAKNLLYRPTFYEIHDLGALRQPRSQDGVSQICIGFLPGGNREFACQRAVTQPFYLRKDKPHPMARLSAAP